MDVQVKPKPKRIVTFIVDEDEARNIAGWLNDAFDTRPNTPYSSNGVRQIMGAFAAVRDGR